MFIIDIILAIYDSNIVIEATKESLINNLMVKLII